MKSLTEAEREAFLADKHIAVLSIDSGGPRPPASAPIWYDYADGLVRFTTGPTTRKARLIEKAGAVTLVVQREDPPYQYVIVEGTVVDTTTPAPDDVQEAIAIRYLGEEGGRAFVRSLEGQPTVMFSVRPDRWLTADFSDEL